MPTRKAADSRAARIWRDAAVSILPPPRLTVSEWADANRVLNSTSPEPGPWRTDRTPYLREIMDSLTPAVACERVVFIKSAQIGGSEVLLNVCGYLMHYAPAPTLMVQPSVEMAKRFSKQRLDALIESAPALRGRVKDPRSRDSGNTILMKEFDGGVLILTGANSGTGLRSLPAKYVLADEVDGWPADADGEGDPFALACRRTTAFGTQRKILAISTPTITDLSRIEALYKMSDQRLFYVPCPRCNHYQVLKWAGVVWDDGNPDTARYQCEGCEARIENWQKTEMLARGEWRTTAEGDGKTRGYHISALYAPVGWPSWAELAADFIEAKKSRETLQVFCNTVWGETWKDEVAMPLDADALYLRREPFAAEVPAGACILTAGVDVQGDRIEIEIVGWGVGEESWSVGYHVIYGDTGQADIWSELDALLLRQWKHENGQALPVRATCVDAGYEMAQVLEFCSPRLGRRVYGIKGVMGFGKPIWPRRATRSIHKRDLFMVGVDTAKERVYSKLRAHIPGPGYCHFPLGRERDYFDMLTAERIKVDRGKRKFGKADGARNEALDCRAYALAALHSLYMGGRFNLENEAAAMKAIPAATVAEKPPTRPVVGSGWMRGF